MCDEQIVKDLIRKLNRFKPEEAPEIISQIIACGDVAIEPVHNEFWYRYASEQDWLLEIMEALSGRKSLMRGLMRDLSQMELFTRHASLKYLYQHGDDALRLQLVPYMVEDIGRHYGLHQFASEKLPEHREAAIPLIITALAETAEECEKSAEHDYSLLSKFLARIGRYSDRIQQRSSHNIHRVSKLIRLAGELDDERLAPSITAALDTLFFPVRSQ